ncbi:conserved Plasmodium protein, unknown function [Plasmodium chabaudi adami]|uniref:Uroporphyrinogen-III synthase n=1 Tax=Plasmodium chabaudi adami TaxID=5826 RepID=A0A1D3S577_PLACE|nr:conserved Plasmodium protein, unknown function [Plasmodium chabaudi adami]
MKKRLLCWLIIFQIFSLCLKIKSKIKPKIKYLFYIPSLCKQNGDNHKIKRMPFHHPFNKSIDNTNLYAVNCVNIKKNKINNLHLLITSPEAAKIYRLVFILLICYLKKIKQTGDTTKCVCIKNEDKDVINKINKLLTIPIISIGLSTNYALNNELKKNEFYNIYKNMSLENKKKYHINSYEFNKINKNLKNFNIVFTPSISNADTLKRELSLGYFQKQKNNSIDVVWIASAISRANFEDPEMWGAEKEEEKDSNYDNEANHANVTRINCYDTKAINYSKTKLNENSIICLMSNSAVLSFYQNFGNKFNYVICMGKSCYTLLKKLNFINVYYPANSKLESLLNMLVKLHRKVTKKNNEKIEIITNRKLEANLRNTTNNKYKHENQIDIQKFKCMNKQIRVVLTREKHKNYQIKKFLHKKNIPTQIIPCIKTEYKHEGITHLCSAFLSHIQEGP